MRSALISGLFIVFSLITAHAAQSHFDPDQNLWILDNNLVRTTFQLTPEGYFQLRSFANLVTGEKWSGSADAGFVQFEVDGATYDARTQYAVLQEATTAITPSGVRQTIVLQDLNNTAQFTLVLTVYDGQPVIRYGLRYRNLTASTAYVKNVNMLPWSFGTQAGDRFTALRVNQWNVLSNGKSFDTVETELQPDGDAAQVFAGARADQCGWLAVKDTGGRGLFAGWEFDGRSLSAVRHAGSRSSLDFFSAIQKLRHPVAPRDEFTVPSAFLGLFHGDFDEAGFRTQAFTDAVLAKAVPEPKNFPYVGWDSWGYEKRIDEQTLRHNAEIAASLGVDLFTVDLGWSRMIGDWEADPAKFPNGLGTLADYVHSLGMKFGLHFALAEADPNSPVLQQNPDWRSTESSGYFGADSLCLSNEDTRKWIIEQAIRIIDEYHVDWILQDGENMVKECLKATHSHAPDDSNYANAVEGLNAVIAAIQAARPNVLWENCEDGGSMMTFNMVQTYVTSLTNDASGSLDSRHAVYGATYPFPPRYAARYMPQSDGTDRYAANSYRFGGNWVLMNQLTELAKSDLESLGAEIALYKGHRSQTSRAKVFHLEAPGRDKTDAIQSHNEADDSSMAVITRAETAGPDYRLFPRGLDPEARYLVWLESDASFWTFSGEQLMSIGVRVPLPEQFSSEVVHITRQ